MGNLWRRPTWWQSLAAAFAVGLLITGLVVALTGSDSDAGQPPEVVQERPRLELAVTYRPTRDAGTAQIVCGDVAAQATGPWAADPDGACSAAYAAAPALLEPPGGDGAVCNDRDASPQRFTVTGLVGTERVERTFSRVDACAEEAWQAARVLIGPWLQGDNPEADEPGPAAG